VKRPRVSRTSQLIAAAMLHAATRPELARWIPGDDLALYRARLPLCSAYAQRLTTLSGPGWRWLSRLVERSLLPGIVAHYVIRKVILRQMADHAVRTEGAQQVVIVGAGLDLLGRRLAAGFPAATVVETDRRDSIAMKETLLGSDRPGNLVLLPHDGNLDSLGDSLAMASQFRTDRATLILAEGVLMYCTADEVQRLLVTLQRLVASPLRLVFTFMEAGPAGRIRFRNQSPLVTWWLARSGESFRWGIAGGDLDAFLDRAGFRLESIVRSADYAAKHQLLPAETSPPADGEQIASAHALRVLPSKATPLV
jgi:methyltransferase (TIGR00027 family)